MNDHFSPVPKPAPPRPRRPEFFIWSMIQADIIDGRGFPTTTNIGDAYFYQGKYAQALATYESSRWPAPGWAYAALDRREDARKWIATSEAEWARGGAPVWVAWNLARTYATLGERAEALTWLERTYDANGGFVVYLKVHPQFDSLRGEPRFQSLLRKVGLAG